MDSREHYLAALDELPRTFVHGDAVRPNLIATQTSDGSPRTIAIDWAGAGIGEVGEDVAAVVAGSILHGRILGRDAEHLERAVFTGYLAGLESAGYTCDPRIVRYGVLATTALRWWPAGLLMLNDALDAERDGGNEQGARLNNEARIENATATIGFTLKLLSQLGELLPTVRRLATTD